MKLAQTKRVYGKTYSVYKEYKGSRYTYEFRDEDGVVRETYIVYPKNHAVKHNKNNSSFRVRLRERCITLYIDDFMRMDNHTHLDNYTFDFVYSDSAFSAWLISSDSYVASNGEAVKIARVFV